MPIAWRTAPYQLSYRATPAQIAHALEVVAECFRAFGFAFHRARVRKQARRVSPTSRPVTWKDPTIQLADIYFRFAIRMFAGLDSTSPAHERALYIAAHELNIEWEWFERTFQVQSPSPRR